jgi:hypothetical protein
MSSVIAGLPIVARTRPAGEAQEAGGVEKIMDRLRPAGSREQENVAGRDEQGRQHHDRQCPELPGERQPEQVRCECEIAKSDGANVEQP